MKTFMTLTFVFGTIVGLTHADSNPLSLANGMVVFDVQERLRLENQSNMYDFNSHVDSLTDEAFLLQRARLGLLVKPVSWVRAYAQAQDTRQFFNKVDNVPFVLGSGGDDNIDLRQAFVEAGDLKEFPLVAKVGRQELSYGDERLVGVFDWNNFTRTFDAVKLHYQNDERHFWADAFAARVVTIQDNGPQGNYGFQFNDSDGNDNFDGLYAGTTALPFQTTEAYFLYRDKTDNNPLYQDTAGNKARPYDIKQEIYTVGLRMKSTPGQLKGFDYEFEGAYQWGRDGGRLTNSFPNSAGVMLAHHAFAIETKAGYTWTNLTWKPRLGVAYDVASGDKSQNDRSDQSFLNLFPTNHKFYGYMDLFAWKNVHDVSAQVKFTPYQDKQAAWRNVTVQLDYHAFWLYTNEDAWYRANAVSTVRPVNAAAENSDKFVGTELDLTVGFAPLKWTKVQAGYSHFFSGNYVTDTAAGTAGANDADFAYVQTVISF
ncbi:MAG: alginate export family protein [Verrucomicrobiota bacterium]